MRFNDYLEKIFGEKVAVVGAGVSNTPLIEALLSAGINTMVCDKRSRRELGELGDRFFSLGAQLSLGRDYLENLSADIIFRTPGIMPANAALIDAQRRGAKLTSEMEVFFEVCPCMIIAVTGSDGKTTTTSLIAQLLKNEGRTVHVGGNIGTPLLCKADEMAADDIAVLELSSFQLITMKASPDIAVFINITPNHLDIHKDMREYAIAKCNIFAHQNDKGRAVFNCDNDFTRNCTQTAAAGEVLLFSRRERVCEGYFCEEGIVYESSNGKIEQIIEEKDILLPGKHNVENFMAALCAVRGLAGRRAIIETAKTFPGVSHRIEMIRQLHAVTYYNDSIATSPARTIAGLRSFDKKVILIAGGKEKGVPFDELAAEIPKRVKTLVLTGKTAEKIKSAVISAPGYAGSPDIIVHEDFVDAVFAARDAAVGGDIVLLSPACASFDRFANFAERGDFFRQIVNSDAFEEK